jgi:FG-GAP repeat
MSCLVRLPHVSATVLGPDRWLGLLVRLAGAGVCVAAIFAAALVGTVSLSSPSASNGAAARRASPWAKLPVAAREAISRDIGRDHSRFAVTRAGTYLVARGSAIAATFGRDGVVAGSGAGVSLQLGLEAIGRGRALVRAAPATPVSRSNTVSYHRAGIDEWYVNGPLGLEQSFTLDRRIGGAGELTLVVGRVRAGAHASIGPAGTSLTIARGAGSPLRYSNLSVSDARGLRLPARLALSNGRIMVLVDDSHARYPLRIDPTVETGGPSLMATGRENTDGFGFAVAISQDGSTIVVGAPSTYTFGVGNVYVFTRPASGGWQNATAQTATLNVGSANGFGLSLAVSANGGAIVVGAPVYGSTNGTAYVFDRPSGGWQDSSSPAAVLTASDGAPNDRFGDSVAISGDGRTVVAGASDYFSSPASAGAAYVFAEPANGWQGTSTQTAELTPNDGVAGDYFGGSVAISGDGRTVVAGALNHASSGAVYVFTEPTNGWQSTSTQTAELMSSDSQASLGGSVAISADGGTIVADAGGSADVFIRPSSGTWQDAAQTAELPQDNGNGSTFGVAVSGDGGTIMIGALSTTVSGAGRAEEFSESANGWQNEAPTLELGGADVPSAAPLTEGVAISTDGTAVVGSSSYVGGPVLVFLPAPVASSPPLVSGDARQGQTLTESHGSWSSDPVAYAYQWEDCNSAGTACSPIVGATGPSYTLTNADAGHTVVVQEAASNLSATGVPTSSSPTAVVTPLPPTSSTVPAISGTAVEGNTLTASLLTWSNTPTSVSYQWEDCDSNGQNCQPITGATSKTYTLAASDIGDRIVVEESATNAGGTSAPATSAATGAAPESGPVGLEIDNGDYATDNPKVTIEAAWPAGTQSILMSNNGGFRTDTQTVAPAATIDWTLEQTGADRLPKTVYVRFLGVGQDDINFTDDIILDETAPTMESATVSGPGTAQASAARATKLKTYRLRLKAKDHLVGVCAVATNQRRSASGEALTTLTSCKARGILRLSRTVDLKLGTAPRYVRVQNSAGDWSRWLAVKS